MMIVKVLDLPVALVSDPKKWPHSRVLLYPTTLVSALVAFVAVALVVAASTAGCASARDDVVRSINAAGDLGTQTEQVLEQLDRAAQEACALDGACVDEARARFHVAWQAYRDYRAAWLAAAAAARAYDAAAAAGQTPTTDKLLATAAALASAGSALSSAVTTLQQTPVLQ